MIHITFTPNELEDIARVFREVSGASDRPLNFKEREISEKIHGILEEFNRLNQAPREKTES